MIIYVILSSLLILFLVYALGKTYRKFVPFIPFDKNNPAVVHEIKLLEKYASDVELGLKRSELRYNDRNYQVGDLIHFIVVDNSGNVVPCKNLDKMYFQITHIVYSQYMQLGYVNLSIMHVDYFPK